MKNEVREKFYEDPVNLKMVDDGLNDTMKRLEAILAEWRKVSKKALTMQMVTKFIDGHRQAIPAVIEREIHLEKAEKSKLYGEVDLDSLLKMTPKADISDLVEAVNKLSGYITGAGWVDSWSPDCFRIVDDRVEMVTEAIEAKRSRYIACATSPAELKRLSCVRKVIGSLEDLIVEFPEVRREKVTIPGVVTVTNDGKLQASPDFVKEKADLSKWLAED